MGKVVLPGKSDGELERIAVAIGREKLALGDADLDEVADVARRIMQMRARRANAILSPSQQRTYAALSPAEKEGMRSATAYVILALIGLEHIDAFEG